MKALLVDKDLWEPLEIAIRDRKDPKGKAITTEATTEQSEKDRQAAVKEEAALKKLDQKAHAKIIRQLDDEILTNVAGTDSGSDLWLKLEDMYMTRSLTNKLYLKKKLYDCRMTEGMPINDHLDRFTSALLELRNIGVVVDDEDAALQLLVSLPMSYEHYVDSCINRKDGISLEEVKTSLKTRELRRKASGNEADTQSSGLVASSNNRGSSGKNNNQGNSSHKKGPKPGDICNFCKEKGHWKFDCPRKKQGKAPVRAEAMMARGSSSDEDYALVTSESARASDAWIFDSGASYHISPRREWFTDYRQMDGGDISMANSEVCKVIGIGSIKVRTHDGKFVILNEVRHVPLMTKNLISLSQLDSKGFSFKGKGGAVSVCNGSEVILRGLKRGSLYFLQGKTLTESAKVASEEVNEGDMSKLWHIRLSHMSNQGMHKLVKRDLLCGHKIKDLKFY